MKGYSRTPQFDKRKYPLRKVVKRDVSIQGAYYNELECGHLIKPAKDFYGEIFSVSQRCKECFRELELINQ